MHIGFGCVRHSAGYRVYPDNTRALALCRPLSVNTAQSTQDTGLSNFACDIKRDACRARARAHELSTSIGTNGQPSPPPTAAATAAAARKLRERVQRRCLGPGCTVVTNQFVSSLCCISRSTLCQNVTSKDWRCQRCANTHTLTHTRKTQPCQTDIRTVVIHELPPGCQAKTHQLATATTKTRPPIVCGGLVDLRTVFYT